MRFDSLPPVIGLSGKKQAGKDAACSIISSLHGGAVVRLAFADALKEEAARACGVSVDFIEQHKADFRVFLQWYGTNFRRHFYGVNYWLDRLHDKYCATRADLIIVTDCRFPNEAELVKSLGGVMVRIDRDTPAEDGHASEVSMEDFDFDYRVVNP